MIQILLRQPIRLFLAVLLLAGCRAPTDGGRVTPIGDLTEAVRPAGQPLRVVATTSILADVVGRVGGDDIVLTTLVPPGADPHAFEPTPQDRRALDEADLVVMSGLGLEPFLQSGSLPSEVEAPLVSLSEGIEPLTSGDGDPDPHVWMDPANVLHWAENAAQALSRLDPEAGERYAQRSAAYELELEALDLRLAARVDQVPADRRKLVTDHETLGYFAARYGFEIIGAVIPSPSSSADASARELAALEEAIRASGAPAVFTSTVVGLDLSQRVADDTGARLVPVYVESLTGADGPAPTYVALMDYNVGAIVEALLDVPHPTE
jgi:manganese/iron transport system substrate-binding protein